MDSNRRKSRICPRAQSLATKQKLQVIFLKQTDVGQPGEVLWVRKGLARNYFLPRKEAVFATPTNLEKHKQLIAVSCLGLLLHPFG